MRKGIFIRLFSASNLLSQHEHSRITSQSESGDAVLRHICQQIFCRRTNICKALHLYDVTCDLSIYTSQGNFCHRRNTRRAFPPCGYECALLGHTYQQTFCHRTNTQRAFLHSAWLQPFKKPLMKFLWKCPLFTYNLLLIIFQHQIQICLITN